MSKTATITLSDKSTFEALPCPHCGSLELASGFWCLDEDGEVDAVECEKCFAGAPVKVWNQRTGDHADADMSEALNSGDGAYRP